MTNEGSAFNIQAIGVIEEKVSLPSVQEHAFQGLGETVINSVLVTKLKEWLQLKSTTIRSIGQSQREPKMTGRVVISLLYVQRRVDKE
jgi:hypothetical protein